ncbi:MAG: DUF2892 domain-containing protein [Syntrophomonadaceae bacterium]|jgi:hypothetical protein|nr:DUF2892 domain-containing protein [Syntrophomonadaceae bacterium]
MEFKKDLTSFDRSLRVTMGLFLIGLVILQPVLLNSTWQIVLAVMGLGMLAEGFNTRY